MKSIIFISLLFLQWQPQTSTIIGKWSYAKYETSKQQDEQTKAFLNNAFSKFSYDFREDATYDFQKSRKKETGTWKADTELITTTNSDGVTDKIKFLQKHKDTLKIEIEPGDFVVFYRNKQ